MREKLLDLGVPYARANRDMVLFSNTDCSKSIVNFIPALERGGDGDGDAVEAMMADDEMRPRAELLGCPICGKLVPSVVINEHIDEHVGAEASGGSSADSKARPHAAEATEQRPARRRPSSKLS